MSQGEGRTGQARGRKCLGIGQRGRSEARGCRANEDAPEPDVIHHQSPIPGALSGSQSSAPQGLPRLGVLNLLPSSGHEEGSELASPFHVGSGGLPPAGWSHSALPVGSWEGRLERSFSGNFYRPSPWDTRGGPAGASFCLLQGHSPLRTFSFFPIFGGLSAPPIFSCPRVRKTMGLHLALALTRF